MKTRTLLRRLQTSVLVVLTDPGTLARAPRFLLRALREGPKLTSARLRALTNPSRCTPNNYRSWLARFHEPSQQEREAMRVWATGMQNPPKIAVLMPVFNPNCEWLQQAIDSVRDQLYPHWQLCIADDCSTDPEVCEVLKAAADADQRIRVVFRNQNGHISAASNSALELVDASWVALLDHDDLLAEDALAWIARSITEHPKLQMIFSDEDKIDSNGLLRDPYFKCDWNPILMEGQNAIGHLCVYRTQLLREIGGFRTGYEGAQDHDLALRCSRQLMRDQILHLPRILYHWRSHTGSTANRVKAKPYSLSAGERVVLDYLNSLDLPVLTVDRTVAGLVPSFASPADPPLVSVIVPTRNGLDVLELCLRSLLGQTDYPNLEVLVVDNGSDDPATLAFLIDLEQAGLIRVLQDPSPFNYSGLNNRAVEQTSGEFLCLMNNDIEVIQPDWLVRMLAYAQRAGTGAVGARLLYPNRCIQHAGVLLGIGGVAGHAHQGIAHNDPSYYCRAQLAQEMSAVTGACLLLRKRHYEAVGGLDAENLRVAFNDVDLCLKLVEYGLHNVYAASAVLVHHESVSRGYEDTPEKQARFAAEAAYMQKKWGYRLTRDPAYNSNLSLEGSPFSLAWPPRLERWLTDGQDC